MHRFPRQCEAFLRVGAVNSQSINQGGKMLRREEITQAGLVMAGGHTQEGGAEEAAFDPTGSCSGKRKTCSMAEKEGDHHNKITGGSLTQLRASEPSPSVHDLT